MDASLIDYARCHGLASPYLEIDPLCHVGHPRSNTLPDALSECDDRLSNARAALEERLRQEKLYVPVKASRVLASTIHEGQAERIKVEWVDILPHFQPFDNMKLEVPIFPIEYKKDALRYNCHDIGLQLSDLPRKIANSDPGATDSPDIHVTKTILFEKIRKEKLLCTKVSIPLMQSARDGGKTPVKELREGLDSLLEIIRTHHDDHSPPDLVPLSPTHFPPSPTLVSDEHMLPSPVASEIMDPGSTVRWILALANKHACQLPPERSHAQYTNGFTPINPKPQLSAMLGDAAEGSWEIFLRHMGLNPFAAHAMMAILRKDRQADTSGSGKSVGSLSRFLEMSSEDRTVLFGGLLGGNVLRHIDSLIEKDWQCDWALDFGGVVD
ncbi:hypothetical protein BJX64DRAFT_291269 [Aspergillus heterothallicus]